MIHLDTNAVIAILNERPAVARTRFDAARGAGVVMGVSMIVFHELMYGAAVSARRSANENKIAVFLAMGRAVLFPFEDEDARQASDIRAHLKQLGLPIGPYDLLIAAQARRRGATLVTSNLREFDRVRGLAVIDWGS